MANREQGEVAIDVQGDSYTLAMTTDAMCELEDLFSTVDRQVTFEEILGRVGRNSVRHIRAFIWAALRKHHKDMTLKDAAALIDRAGGIVGLSEKLVALANTTQPDPEDLEASGVKEESRPPRAQARKPAGRGGISSFKPAVSA